MQIDDMGEIEYADDTIEAEPCGNDSKYGTSLIFGSVWRISGRPIIAGKLPLTAHALRSGGEQAQDHLHHKEQPRSDEDAVIPIVCTLTDAKSVKEIGQTGAQKDDTSQSHFPIMNAGDGGQPGTVIFLGGTVTQYAHHAISKVVSEYHSKGRKSTCFV